MCRTVASASRERTGAVLGPYWAAVTAEERAKSQCSELSSPNPIRNLATELLAEILPVGPMVPRGGGVEATQASIPPAPQKITVGIDAPIAQERPHAPHLLAAIQVDLGDQQFFAIR